MTHTSTNNPEANEPETDEQILSRIDKRVNDWFSYFRENNQHYEIDTKFVYDEDGQWTAQEISEYRQEFKPRMSFNMAPRFILNLQGEFASNTPALQSRALDNSTASQARIDLSEGITRKISFDSRNNIIYQTTFGCALSGGYGAYGTEVVPETVMSFNLIPRFYLIQDPTTCFWDPSARDPDKGDGALCGRSFTMSKDEFKSRFPDVEAPESYSAANSFSRSFSWLTENDIVVVDYYEKEYFKRHIAQLSDGAVMDFDKAEELVERSTNIANKIKKLSENSLEPIQSQQIPKLEIVKDGMVDDFKIVFYRAVKGQIIDRSEWDGKKLPIIFQPGVSRWVDGKEKTISFIHWMKDAQRAYNYSRSEYMYRLKLTRYEPFLLSEGMAQGHEREWKEAHRARAALFYKEVPSGKIPVRQPPQEVPQSLLAASNQSLSDMQNTTGRFEANLGAQGNETSGVAIQSRQAPGNMNAFQFFENARLAIESGARVISDLLPKLFDTERNVSVQQDNGKIISKTINVKDDDDTSLPLEELNIQITVGSSFEQQQAQAVEQLLSLVSALPPLGAVVPDLVVENLNIKNAPQLVKRIQDFVLNPMMVAQESGDPQKIQQAQAQTQQQQQVQQAMEQLQMLLQKTAAQDDQIRALASQTSSQANMMNAQTNRIEAISKGAVESQKAEAEENKANMELVTQVVKTAGEVGKIQQDQIL